MTSMDQIHRIRDLYYGQDKSLKEIAIMENLVTVQSQCHLDSRHEKWMNMGKHLKFISTQA